ncbi:Xanthine/uracil permeases [Bacillus subtilis J27]|nr:Xanthine/uracil permeases [Bacillus subtilis J27]
MKLVLGALQWTAFIIAAAIVVPVAVAQSFHLDHSDSARLIQSTFFVLGIAAVIQCLKGHRLPINESPAGLWWGVYTIYAGLTGTVFATYGDTLRGLQGALLVSAVCFFLLSVFKVIDRLAKLFTPVVTGVYLLLLVMQLSQPIIKRNSRNRLSTGRGARSCIWPGACCDRCRFYNDKFEHHVF